MKIDFDSRDRCLQVSLYYAAKILLRDVSKDDQAYYDTMIKDCWLDWVVWNRKSPEYKWSNSGAEALSENTLFNRPTKWIYDHILKYFNLDLFKGLNGDAYRSYILTLYLKSNWGSAFKLKLGFLLRAGFTPSLCENALFKPQAYVLLFKVKYPYYIHMLWYPIYLICKLFFYFSFRKEMKVPIHISTTNKITMLPTAYLLGFKMPNKAYIDCVYDEYFNGSIVGQVLKEAISEKI